MDEETEDPFGHLQYNLDKHLTTSSSSEHSLPSVPESCTIACSTVLQQQQPAPLACFFGQRLQSAVMFHQFLACSIFLSTVADLTSTGRQTATATATTTATATATTTAATTKTTTTTTTTAGCLSKRAHSFCLCYLCCEMDLGGQPTSVNTQPKFQQVSARTSELVFCPF